jgi:hypothetical protein
MKIFPRSHSSEDLHWISSENFVKIFRILLWRFESKIFKRSLVQIFLKSTKNLQTKIYEDLQKNEISRRSYVKIFRISQKRFGSWSKFFLNIIKFWPCILSFSDDSAILSFKLSFYLFRIRRREFKKIKVPAISLGVPSGISNSTSWFFTVKVMIMFLYRDRPVTVFEPTLRNVTSTLSTITDHY